MSVDAIAVPIRWRRAVVAALAALLALGAGVFVAVSPGSTTFKFIGSGGQSTPSLTCTSP